MSESDSVGIFKTRGPVVRLDRTRKAKMIEVFLQEGLGRNVVNQRILDIGCGNGMISHYFSGRNDVIGVDVEDLRRDDSVDFEYVLVDSERLPFDSDSFDIVLSHHVIEHVTEQKLHLREMWRVLKTGGLAYLGTPNRSSPAMEGHVGNDSVLHYRQMMPLFRDCGFEPELLSFRMVSNPDRYFGEIRFGRFLPRCLLKRMAWLFPSQYFLLHKN
jgi:ubiquinone/menaquinone biosynthesis C-methylase UbiE